MPDLKHGDRRIIIDQYQGKPVTYRAIVHNPMTGSCLCAVTIEGRKQVFIVAKSSLKEAK